MYTVFCVTVMINKNGDYDDDDDDVDDNDSKNFSND